MRQKIFKSTVLLVKQKVAHSDPDPTHAHCKSKGWGLARETRSGDPGARAINEGSLRLAPVRLE